MSTWTRCGNSDGYLKKQTKTYLLKNLGNHDRQYIASNSSMLAIFAMKQSMGDNSQLINDNVNHCPADIALFTQ